MFYYYGRKKRLISYYPQPKYDIIIEPFAGSAPYSFKYYQKTVILCDKDPIICSIWDYLINIADEDRINKLPFLKFGEHINDKKFNNLLPAEKNLIGFFLGTGSHIPRKKIYNQGNFAYNQWNKNNREKLAKNLWKIKHWIIYNGDYKDLKNIKCTWFIDPPYQSKGGEKYRFSNKLIDYSELAKWIKNRKGQVIACENNDSIQWLPFKKLITNRTLSGNISQEMIYYKD